MKPAVHMLRIKESPISMWFAGQSYVSWKNLGYEVNFIDAITPQTMDDYPNQLNFSDLKTSGKYQRPFSPTEKAVFYSHIKALNDARRKSSPSIIIEHDAELLCTLDPKILDCNIAALGHSLISERTKVTTPALAYYITPVIADLLYKYLLRTHIKSNLDAYVMNYMVKYNDDEKFNYHVLHLKDESLGTTIDHPKGTKLNGSEENS